MNKRLKLFLISLVVVSSGQVLVAQIDPFFPPNPQTIGTGGAFTADAEGYNAFFYNPAGFAGRHKNSKGEEVGKNELTLTSINAYVSMDRRMFDLIWNWAKTGQAPDFTNAAVTGSQAFSNVVSDFQPYITALNSANPTNLATAVKDPSVTAYYASGVDPNSITSVNAAIAAFKPELFTNPTQLDAALQALMTQAGVSVTGAQQTAFIASMNSALSAAANLPRGNLDVGATLGLGWVGGGFGFGVFAQAEAILRTPDTSNGHSGSLLDASGRVISTLSASLGLAFDPFENFTIGVGLRPTFLSYGDMSVIGLLPIISQISSMNPSQIFNTLVPLGVLKSFYVGVDVGVLWRLGDITLGAAVKDLIPQRLQYQKYTDLGSWASSFPFKLNGTSVGYSKDNYYVTSYKINVGISWHPNFGEAKNIIDLKINADIFDLLQPIRYLAAIGSKDPALLVSSQYNILQQIGVGAELKLFNLASFRAGFYKGFVTAGLGLDLIFLDINISGQFRDLDLSTPVPGFSEVGVAFEVAIKF